MISQNSPSCQQNMPQLRRYVVTAVMQSWTFLETINNKYWAVIVDLEIWVHGLFTFIHEYILYFIQSLCLFFAHEELKIAWL